MDCLNRIEKIIERLQNFRAENISKIEDKSEWMDNPKILADDDAFFVTEMVEEINNGWTDREIFKYYSNMEEYNPELDEHIALRNMERIQKDAMTRIGDKG